MMSRTVATQTGPANAEIARILREIADLLELSDANQFRIRAYRNAARVIEESPQSIATIDILPDGALDLDDDTLASLDIVFVSLHSSLGLSPERQTARIVRALRNPHVNVLGHPTGRLINRRRGARFDLDEVCRVAAGEGVLLEINAQPERLDLDVICARRAQELGASFVISTDAHSTEELGFMRWGVDQARRGWIERKRVANTRPLHSLLALLGRRPHKKRTQRGGELKRRLVAHA